MTGYRVPLLCELHAHTTWSDGALTVRELADLYGRAGFDVLAVTDHTCRDGAHVTATDFDAYLEEIDAEAARARALYGLVLLPGLELTYDDRDAREGAHAVALGLRTFVGVRDGIEGALRAARAAGAALIAVHPYTSEQCARAPRGTARFAEQREWANELVDAFELFNRHDIFQWVADERLPAVANGDFHRPEHLATWKTLLPCARDAEAVVDHLRRRDRLLLTRITAPEARGRLAA